MKFREIVRYEIHHRLRSASTWIYAALFLLLGFAIIHVAADDPLSPTHANAPIRLALLASMLGMLGMLVSAAFFADAAIRDHETGMAPLVFTAPIRKIDYLGGRFLGALTINALLHLGIPLGQAVATRMPYLPADAFGPFVAGAFVQTYLLFLLPNVILTGAILFTVAVLTRQSIPVYLAAIGIFIGYVIAVNLPAWGAITNVLTDPLGLRVLTEITERWTPFEKNTRLLGGSAALLTNRAVWLAFAVGILALLHRRFHFATRSVTPSATPDFIPSATPDVIPSDAPHVIPSDAPHVIPSDAPHVIPSDAPPVIPSDAPPVIPSDAPHVIPSDARDLLFNATLEPRGVFDLRTTLHQTIEIARRATAELVTSPVFILLFVAKIGMTLLFGWEAGETVFDTSTTPVTILIIERLADTPLVPITYLLVAIFAGELIWNDRQHDTAEISDAAPLSESAALTGRFIALAVIMAILQFPVLIGGMLAQILQGYTNFEIGVYLRILFGLQLADLVLLSALAILIHVIVNQKYLAHLVVVLLLIGRVAARMSGWIENHLLLYGTDPGWKYSGMNGFGPFIRPFVWFKLYWAAWAAILLVFAVLLLVRGVDTGLGRRLSAARARFGGPVMRAAATAAFFIVALGGFVFYNTSVLNEYRSAEERGAPQAAYEKRYRRYLDIPQPTIVDAALRVEIYPGRAAELRGTFTLVNRTNMPIDSVHVVVEPDAHVHALSLDRQSQVALADTEAGYRIFALDRPLAPGDSATLSFDTSVERHGFSNASPLTALANNGTWIDRRFLPFVGYQPAFELSDRSARERFGLARQEPAPAASDAGRDRMHLFIRGDADLVHLDAIVGTSADQTPITPGMARRTWMENGRRYVEYETNPPTDIGGGFFSARYEVDEDRWRDVNLRVLYHPDDRENVGRMMHGMKASLEYYTTHFGAYPDSLLQVMEIPRYSVFGIGLPFGMAFSEDAFHSHVKNGEIDQPFYGVAHETAHHWWGGMVRPAPVKGHGLLTESLANYSAIIVMEKNFGADVARRVYHFQMDRYFRGRGEFSHEVPLVDVEDQAYLAYRKGAVALYALRDQIGEEAMNAALHRYVEKFANGGPPYATSLDLITELRAATPDSVKSLITDLFETVTLWEVKLDSATVERTSDGKYQVTLAIDARKLRADSIGRETEVPMNDLVQIGVFAEGSNGALGRPLYLERQRIHGGKQTIRVVVSQEPSRAGIDPYDMLIDRQRGDNVREVRVTAGGRR